MSKKNLYHISDRADIVRFDPLPAPSGSGQTGKLVWGIDDQHLHNYLLPRECPRVTFSPGPETTKDDFLKFFSGSADRAVVAVETEWLDHIRSAELYCYTLPAKDFYLLDPIAGYHVAEVPVVPEDVVKINDILKALSDAEVEFRMMKSLWLLHDAVAASSLHFSMIRMRNAMPK